MFLIMLYYARIPKAIFLLLFLCPGYTELTYRNESMGMYHSLPTGKRSEQFKGWECQPWIPNCRFNLIHPHQGMTYRHGSPFAKGWIKAAFAFRI